MRTHGPYYTNIGYLPCARTVHTTQIVAIYRAHVRTARSATQWLIRPKKKLLLFPETWPLKIGSVGRSFLNFSPTIYYRFKWSAYKPVQILAAIYKNSIKFLVSAGKN